MKRVNVFVFVFLCYAVLASGHAPLFQNDSVMYDEISEVVVSSTRANRFMPIAFVNLKSIDINRIMSMPEIPSAVSFSPSVVKTSENGGVLGNQTFRVRGSDATRINVTFDGVPVNDGESQSVFWANMPDLMSSLQSVQIQRGVGTSSNGAGAFGATLNMESYQPATQPYGQTSFALGSFNTLKMNLAAGTGRSKNGWNADFRYSLGQTDGYVENGGANQQSFFLTSSYSSSRRIVKMNLFHGDQKTNISWEGVPEEEMAKNRRYNPSGLYTNSEGNVVRYNNETDNYKQTHIHLHSLDQVNEKLKITTTTYYTRGLGYYEQYRFNDWLNRYNLPSFTGTPSRSDLIRRRWLDNNLFGVIVTARYTTEKTTACLGLTGNNFFNDHFGNIIWAPEGVLHDVIPKDHEWYHNTGKKSDLSSYLKVTHQIGGNWYLFGDVQLRYINYKLSGIDNDLTDLSQKNQYLFFNPKAGITFSISQLQRAYISFAVGNREPSRADIKDALKNGGKEIPRPETLYNLETGYEFDNGVWNFGANYFRMLYVDQLVNTGKMNDVGYVLMENVPNSYRRGIEMIFGVKPSKTLQVNGNMAYSINKIRDYIAYVETTTTEQHIEYLGTTNIAFSPNWVGAADVTCEVIKGLSIGMTAKYVGAQYYDNTSNDSRRLDAYFVNNAFLQYRLGFKNYFTILHFTVNNLWNADYISNAVVYRGYTGNEEWVSKYFFPQPFRNYMVKLSVGFK